MPKRRGREAKLRIREVLYNVGGSPIGDRSRTIGSLNAKSITIESGSADVTTPDATDPADPLWTETLDTTKRLTISGDGVFADNDGERVLNREANSTDPCEYFYLDFPEWGTFAGFFYITSFEIGGESEAGVTFSLTLESDDRGGTGNEPDYTPPALQIRGLSDRSAARNSNVTLGTATTNSDAAITWTIDPTVSGVTISSAGRLRYRTPNAAQQQTITVRATEQGGHGRTVTITILITVP